jgi:hypothetical protein
MNATVLVVKRVPAWVGLLFALSAAATLPARAVEQASYAMDVLIDGRPIAEYEARGRVYVEALAGREYSIRLSNRTGGRIAVALAVDGLNSIDAQTTSADEAAKWILGPYETIVIDGWQTSSSNARHFYFTSEKASYGAWLGQTDNLGVISAAVFRERQREALRLRRYDSKLLSEPRPAEAPASAKPAPQEEGRRDADKEAGASAEGQAQLSDELAATGIGREVDHDVTWVNFDAEPAAAANLELRYEYRAALIRLGVLPAACPPDRLAERERSHGFTDTGFAPDPYRRGCR